MEAFTNFYRVVERKSRDIRAKTWLVKDMYPVPRENGIKGLMVIFYKLYNNGNCILLITN